MNQLSRRSLIAGCTLLLALAMSGLPAAASEIITNETAHVFMTRNVPKQVSEVADWSTPLDLPAGPRFMHVVSFCQENTARYWEGAMSCRATRYAQGVAGAPGYIQLIDLEKFGAERNSAPGSWSRPYGTRGSWVASTTSYSRVPK